MEYKFTNSAQQALEIANELASQLGHNYIGTEHILYGLATEANGVASKVLENQGVTGEDILKEIEVLIGVNEEVTDIETIGFTPRSKRVIENAFLEAKKSLIASAFISFIDFPSSESDLIFSRSYPFNVSLAIRANGIRIRIANKAILFFII